MVKINKISFGQLIVVPAIAFFVMILGGTDPQKAILISLFIAVVIKIFERMR